MTLYFLNNLDICRNYIVNVSNEDCFVNDGKVLNEMVSFGWMRLIILRIELHHILRYKRKAGIKAIPA